MMVSVRVRNKESIMSTTVLEKMNKLCVRVCVCVLTRIPLYRLN